MKRIIALLCAVAALALVLAGCTENTAAIYKAAARQVKAERLTDPAERGDYYTAEMPDTLDLAQRAALALPALKSAKNCGDAWGDVVSAIAMARNMSGVADGVDGDSAVVQKMLDYVRKSKTPANESPAASRALSALVNIYEIAGHTESAEKFFKTADCLYNSYIPYDGENREYGDNGYIGYSDNLRINGATLYALSYWINSGLEGYGDGLMQSAETFKDALLNRDYWVAESKPKAVSDFERGYFNGTFAAYTEGLLGLLEYADITDDLWLKNFVRSSYEYIRTFGLSAVGLYGDTCAAANMTLLAVRLSEMGVGQYYDDAERYVRNTLAEQQILDGANAGMFYSSASHPLNITPNRQQTDICCTAKAVMAMYAVWDAAVTGGEDMAEVNLLINRCSPLLDVSSYQPYEGKAVLNVKTARNASALLPKWVDMGTVRVMVNGAEIPVVYQTRRLLLTGLKPGDAVVITFDMREWDESYSLKWREDETYTSTDPGEGWANDAPDGFTFTFRGYTVVGVAQAEGVSGNDYRLYQRGGLLADAAPMVTAERYAPFRTLRNK